MDVTETIDCGQGVTVNIFLEEYTEDANPREFDNPSRMYCWHSRYILGDKHDHEDKHAALMAIAAERAEARGEEDKEFYRLEDGWEEDWTDEELGEYITKDSFLSPLYLYDHSGITISMGSFSCRWDSGIVGFILVTPQMMDVLGCPYTKLNWKQKFEEYAKLDVKEYDLYIMGMVYGYAITTPDRQDVDDVLDNDEDYEYTGRCFLGKETAIEEGEMAAKWHVEQYADPMRMAGAWI